MAPRADRSLLDRDALPLYLRLAERIAEDLTAEGGAGGARLPSERRLVEHYDASRVTIRAALTELRDRGVLVSLPGRGWAVAPPAVERRPRPEGVRGFSDLAVERGVRPRSRVLETAVRAATHAEAEQLRTVAGTELFEMWRVRCLNDLAIALEHNRLPLSVAPALPTVDFDENSLYDTLRAADPPRHPHHAEYSVEARNPTDREIAELGIEGPIPILAATQLTFDEHGEPVELTVQAYRGDRYTFRASITD